MPHRRVFKKGSFGGHLDELVKHFADHGPAKSQSREQAKRKQVKAAAKLNQDLFERATR